MNHRVNNVKQLYDDAAGLYKNVVIGGASTSADSIIANLNAAITNLKSCWEGKDAGVKIQKVILVHNALVEIRNALGSLASDSSKVAADYREIQNRNGAQLEQLYPVAYEDKVRIEDYVDNRDTINISQEANTGKAKLDAAKEAIDGFSNEVKRYYSLIMDNWTMGGRRDNATAAFDKFISQVEIYKNILNDVSSDLTRALQNYQM